MKITRPEILELVITTIYNLTDLDEDENNITEDSLIIKDLNIDDLDLTDILLELEDNLGILINEEGLVGGNNATVKDIVDRVVEIL